MKHLLILPLLLIGVVTSGQNILRVNNLGAVASAPYSSIDGAISAAAIGDIILVEGSATDYTLPANYTLTKRVTILGPGYLLSANAGIQANPLSATMTYSGNFIFASGSEGTIMSGMVTRNPIEIRVSNITLSHNALYTIFLTNTTPCSNFWFHANYPGAFNTFGVPLLSSTGSTVNTTYTNIVISNNIFNWRIDMGSTKYGLFVNNIIDSNPISASNLTNFEVINSVFNNLNGLTLTNPAIQNNVFCGTGYYPVFDPTLNNIVNATLSNVIAGAAGNTADSMYKLKAGSPAIGAGVGGADIGVFGGSNPYTLSGIAEGLPTLSNFSSPGLVPQNGTLNVKVSAKSN